MERQRREVRNEREQLLTLVNQWDPAGRISGGAPRDAYATLVDNLLSFIFNERSEPEVVAFLEREVRQQFGVKPADASRFATKILAWSHMEEQ